uniref:RGS domain-containing protein n=1 Tax=Esox lucius TaxID=8010 RepID=A0AAY5KUH8_ESOLU
MTEGQLVCQSVSLPYMMSNSHSYCRAKQIKVKFGTLLQRPDHDSTKTVIIPPKTAEGYLEAPPKLDRPSREEASLWGKALDNVLINSYGLATFWSFLKSEFSEENLEFWVACEDYKRTGEQSRMAGKAEGIYKEFLKTGAQKEVNIDHLTKDATLKNLASLSPTTFDLAQRQVFALMEKDSYGRFLKSNQYQDIIK